MLWMSEIDYKDETSGSEKRKPRDRRLKAAEKMTGEVEYCNRMPKRCVSKMEWVYKREGEISRNCQCLMLRKWELGKVRSTDEVVFAARLVEFARRTVVATTPSSSVERGRRAARGRHWQRSRRWRNLLVEKWRDRGRRKGRSCRVWRVDLRRLLWFSRRTCG